MDRMEYVPSDEGANTRQKNFLDMLIAAQVLSSFPLWMTRERVVNGETPVDCRNRMDWIWTTSERKWTRSCLLVRKGRGTRNVRVKLSLHYSLHYFFNDVRDPFHPDNSNLDWKFAWLSIRCQVTTRLQQLSVGSCGVSQIIPNIRSNAMRKSPKSSVSSGKREIISWRSKINSPMKMISQATKNRRSLNWRLFVISRSVLKRLFVSFLPFHTSFVHCRMTSLWVLFMLYFNNNKSILDTYTLPAGSSLVISPFLIHRNEWVDLWSLYLDQRSKIIFSGRSIPIRKCTIPNVSRLRTYEIAYFENNKH